MSSKGGRPQSKKNSPQQVQLSAESRYLTIRQAAVYLGCTIWCARTLVWKGLVPVVRLGKRFIFLKDDLDRFMAEEKAEVGR